MSKTHVAIHLRRTYLLSLQNVNAPRNLYLQYSSIYRNVYIRYLRAKAKTQLDITR